MASQAHGETGVTYAELQSPAANSRGSARLIMRAPDDWHVHFRDDAMLRAVLPDTARRFARAIVMPNLEVPVTTTEQMLA